MLTKSFSLTAIAVILLARACSGGASVIQEPSSSSSSDVSRSLLFLRRRAQPIAALQLVDTKSGNVVAELNKNGMTIDMKADSTVTLTVRALAQGSRTRAVGFVQTSSNSAGTASLIATSAPYTLCGKTSGGTTQACASLVSGTTHTVTATAYSCRKARCGASLPLSLSFTIGNPKTPVAPSPTPKLSPVVVPTNPLPVSIPVVQPSPVFIPVVTPVTSPKLPVAPVPMPIVPVAPVPMSIVPVAPVPMPIVPVPPVAVPQVVPVSPLPPKAAPVLTTVSIAPVPAPAPKTPLVSSPVKAPSSPVILPPAVAPSSIVSPVKAPVILSPATAPKPLYTCDLSADTCVLQNNDECNTNNVCDPFTDCFDCDPCRRHAYTSCETCTRAPEGCLWCDTDASCISPGMSTPKSMTCKATDHLSTCIKQGSPPFSDPLYNSMLSLYDMINVQDVWKMGVTGKGIGIRINDNGVDSNHPEFSSKFEAAASCSLFTPMYLDSLFNHGTTCASLAAGSANNSCAVGIAPDARLSACRMIATFDAFLGFEEEVTPEAANYSYLYANMDTMHISSNSYGLSSCRPKLRIWRRMLNVQQCPLLPTSTPCLSPSCSGVDWSNIALFPSCESIVEAYCSNSTNFEKDSQACTAFLDLFTQCDYSVQTMAEQRALEIGITNGRGGKGIIFVYGAGNDFASGAYVNFEGTRNNRYVISVGAVGKDKVHASYSNSGAALFISAPGGDAETKPNNVVALAGGGCIDGTALGSFGTSFACPVVSGVVALILQVNDNLSWRDVQGILALTAQRVFPLDQSWTTNAVGLRHSYLYGFGIVDARAAVQVAKTWVNFQAERNITVESGVVNVGIAEFQSPSVSTISSVAISAAAKFKVESVVVSLDLSHSSRGDLEIELVSPQGTSSILAPGERPENLQLANNTRWKLMTVRNWGEAANGTWTLRLTDKSRGDLATCINLPSWSVTFTSPTGRFTFGCLQFKQNGACINGGQNPLYNETTMRGWSTGITDPQFTDPSGVSLVQACCDCGGGQLASTVPDVLKSWQLAVYGRLG